MFKLRWVINKNTAEKILKYWNGGRWVIVPVCYDIQIEVDQHGNEVKS
jgi:hypothetical protein